MAEETEAPAPTAQQLTTARRFVAEHGKPAKAVVENIGRAGARVVLVGHDGALGDIVVRTVETGQQLVEAVEDLEPAEWDSATVNETRIGPGHRRRMAGHAL
ncbi:MULTISPECIES: hypothetical protein [Amycolatopsis]|uniref:Uncharacterized protein n=1 Tax=Amycolatopsis viridis TaxID=185678 RepID=A0ABX0SST0_9PSEU|nr:MULTISPECIES: hypothetical protein [Amycolatopsis]NIH80022.1 hypothetical protein [Amycolatopsis viridis]NIH88605.1 hypothetical protein [Amycolatopsis granulosa]